MADKFDAIALQLHSSNATRPEIASALRAAVQEANKWLPIETAPKDCLIDVWIPYKDGGGTRWADCYYDRICDEWRTSQPSGHLVSIKARNVTHWQPIPSAPGQTHE